MSDKTKWTDVLSCILAGLALVASVVSVIATFFFAYQANAIAAASNRIADSSNQLTLELNRRNESFGEYLVKLEQQLNEQSKQPNLISLACSIQISGSVKNCSVLSAVLQNNGERDAVILTIGFAPFDPNLIGAMPGSFNQTPSALKVEEIRRDLQSHNWATPFVEKELFIIPAGKVVCLKIAFPTSVGKGNFYMKYSGGRFVQIGKIE